MTRTVYCLADVNNFYPSVQRVFDPKLRGVPCVVLSNGDSCCVARSAEAKKELGIKMGQPYFQVRHFEKSHGLVACSSNYALYADMSQRFIQTLEEFSDDVRPYSIDECFCVFEGFDKLVNLEEYGQRIKNTVARNTGLPICVGFAPTPTLSKLANHGAKQYPATNGVVDLTSPVRQRKLLAITPVGEIWGIGKRISKRLEDAGIHTGLQLAEADTAWIRKEFSVVVERTVRELNGVVCQDVDAVAPTKQQIVNSKSFGSPITELADMLDAVALYATRASEKLRGEGQACRHVTAFLSTSRYAEGDRYSNSRSDALLHPTTDTRVIVAKAHELIRILWRQGFRYNKAGVMLADFSTPGAGQGDFFDEVSDSSRSQTLMATLDTINQRKGSGTVTFGRQAAGPKAWHMKRDRLSPSYTTRWSDIPTAK